MGVVLILLGLAGLVIALAGLVRGRVRWARIRSRRGAAAALAASVVVFGAGGALLPSSPERGTAAQSLVGTVGTSTSVSVSLSTPRAVTAASATPHFRRVPGSAISSRSSPATPPSTRTTRPRPTSTVSSSPARVRVVAGVVLPDRRRTPGSRFAGVITAQICRAGYSASVRSVSEATRRAVYASYGVAWAARGGYEVDHLIPLELGGNNRITNLWPEPQDPGADVGYGTKDRVENHLHALVCAGKLPLATAQTAIAANWYTAYHRYRGVSATAPAHPRAPPPTVAPDQPSPSPSPSPSRTPGPSASPVPSGGGATALCNDGTYSYSAHHQGACSRHHGVRIFYK